jgi:hypothetical protein
MEEFWQIWGECGSVFLGRGKQPAGNKRMVPQQTFLQKHTKMSGMKGEIAEYFIRGKLWGKK